MIAVYTVTGNEIKLTSQNNRHLNIIGIHQSHIVRVIRNIIGKGYMVII